MNFHKVDWGAVRNDLSHIDWSFTLHTTHIETAWQHFENIVIYNFSNPTTTKHTATNRSRLPREKKTHIRRTKRLNQLKYSRIELSNSTRKKRLELENFHLKGDMKDSIESQRTTKEQCVIKNIKQNPKVIYS